MDPADRDGLEFLRALLAQRTDLALVVLFGSTARGCARPDSDLDVAVVPLGAWSAVDEAAFVDALERATGRDVDLLRLGRSFAARSGRRRGATTRSGAWRPTPRAHPVCVRAVRCRSGAGMARLRAGVPWGAGSLPTCRRPEGAVTDPLLVTRKLVLLHEHVARLRRRHMHSATVLALLPRGRTDASTLTAVRPVADAAE